MIFRFKFYPLIIKYYVSLKIREHLQFNWLYESKYYILKSIQIEKTDFYYIKNSRKAYN